MKYALALVALVAVMAMAEPVVDISGYAKAWYYMFGAEGSNPESSFRGYNWTTLMGRLNDHTYAYLGTNYKTWDGASNINVCDLYLSMDIIPELNVTAGQFKIPLGWPTTAPAEASTSLTGQAWHPLRSSAHTRDATSA